MDFPLCKQKDPLVKIPYQRWNERKNEVFDSSNKASFSWSVFSYHSKNNANTLSYSKHIFCNVSLMDQEVFGSDSSQKGPEGTAERTNSDKENDSTIPSAKTLLLRVF